MEEVARSGLENSVVAAFSQPVSVLPPQLLMPESGRPAPGGSSPRVRPHCEKGFEFYGWHEASRAHFQRTGAARETTPLEYPSWRLDRCPLTAQVLRPGADLKVPGRQPQRTARGSRTRPASAPALKLPPQEQSVEHCTHSYPYLPHSGNEFEPDWPRPLRNSKWETL